MLKVGISKQIITPERGVSLAGYFNPRPNNGVLDDIHVKVVLFKKGPVVTGLVSLEIVKTTLKLVEDITNKLKAKGYIFAYDLIISAIHTHTGPALESEKGGLNDDQYIKLIDKTVWAVEEAFANLQDATLEAAKVNNNPCAFNRRYWMKDGSIKTNPGKLNPNVVRPESPIDDEISIVAIRQNGRLAGIISNICNHTDTIGGNLVSADWPGRMEKAIQNKLGYDIPVLTMIGCSGNINHFDVSNDNDQTCYAEACRIGNIYGNIITDLIDELEAVELDKIQVDSHDFMIPYQVISDERVKEAKATIERIGDISSNKDMTSEGIAAGDEAVVKMFAKQLLDFKKKCSGKFRVFKIINIKLGKDLMFLSSPGEPFTGVGLHIKRNSKFKYNFVITCANGSCGYICMPECYKHGGYEILPFVDGAPKENTSIRLIDVWNKLLNIL